MTDYFTHERDGGLDWHRGDRALREKSYATDLIANEAISVIEKHGGGTPPPNFSWADLLKSDKNSACATEQRIELFNLATDSSESRNLSSSRADLVRELTAHYESYARAAVPLFSGDAALNFKPPGRLGETAR